MQYQEALHTYSLDQNNIFPWVRYCHRLLCQQTHIGHLLCVPSLEDPSVPEVPSLEGETDTHTYSHTRPEGGGQPGFVVEAVFFGSRRGFWVYSSWPRAQEAGAGSRGGVCVLLPCLLARGVLRISQVQVSSESMEEGTGCLSQGSPQPGRGRPSLYRKGWKPQICQSATFQFLELLNPFQPQGLCTWCSLCLGCCSLFFMAGPFAYVKVQPKCFVYRETSLTFLSKWASPSHFSLKKKKEEAMKRYTQVAKSIKSYILSSADICKTNTHVTTIQV